MFALALLIVVFPLLLGTGIKRWLVYRERRGSTPVVESDVAIPLADTEEERRFESSWQALNRHDPHAVDPSSVIRTPKERLLEHHLSRDRDPWKSEIRVGFDRCQSEPENTVSQRFG